MFGSFTYITYTLTEVSGFDASTAPWLLMAFGVGLFVPTPSAARQQAEIATELLRALSLLLIVRVVFAMTASNQILPVRRPGPAGLPVPG